MAIHLGRLLEIISGLALLSLAAAMLFAAPTVQTFTESAQALQTQTLGIVLSLIGIAQIYYSSLAQRRITNLIACAAWTTTLMGSFMHLGMWTPMTVVPALLAFYSFYQFGYQCGCDEVTEDKNNVIR